jgi:hypothetical protein
LPDPFLTDKKAAMRIATYNVENLFSRVSAMNSDDPDKTTVVLEDVAKLQRLIEQPIYSEADKKQMLAILRKHKATGSSGPFFLQETRRRLYSNGKIVAEGRGDWVGSIGWRRDLIQAPAIENTGRIINEIKADILCLVEVESRPVLRRFNNTILKEAPYPHAMLIDGNDERGIDVAISVGGRCATCAVMSTTWTARGIQSSAGIARSLRSISPAPAISGCW